MIDAQTALDYVLGHPELSKSPIILYGQSIGGAVSIDLASRNPSAIRGLILENTFCNLPSLIPTTLPLLSPFQFLCHQKWDSLSKIPLIPRATPILMLSGLRDEIVPPEQMQELWKEVGKRQGKAVGSGEKGHLSGEGLSKFIEYPRGTHSKLSFVFLVETVLIYLNRWYLCAGWVLDGCGWVYSITGSGKYEPAKADVIISLFYLVPYFYYLSSLRKSMRAKKFQLGCPVSSNLKAWLFAFDQHVQPSFADSSSFVAALYFEAVAG